jgi:hypothetical protein
MRSEAGQPLGKVYNGLVSKLAALLGALQSLSTGLVTREKTTKEQVVNGVAGKVPLVGGLLKGIAEFAGGKLEMKKIEQAVQQLRTPQEVSAFALRFAEMVCVRYELQLRKLTDKGAEAVVNYVLAQLTELLFTPAAGEETPDVAQLHFLLLRRLETRGARGKAEAFTQWGLGKAAVFGVASYALETKAPLPLVNGEVVRWSADELFTLVGVEVETSWREAPGVAYMATDSDCVPRRTMMRTRATTSSRWRRRRPSSPWAGCLARPVLSARCLR